MIHILDGQKDTILDYITLDNIISDDHKKSLEDTLETYNFITFADKRFSEYLEKRNRIIIPDEDDSLVEFVIFEAAKYKDTEGHKAQVYAHASYLELKKASIIYPDKGFTGTASQHGGRSLSETGWEIGIVESKGTRTLTIDNHTNPYEILKRVAKEFELELHFRVTHDGNKITGRYVDLLNRVGEWRGREAEFGKDLDGIRRTEKQDIVTALLGLGPEREDGTRLEFLVEDFDALQRWGRIDEYGNLKHLIEPYEVQSERDEMTQTELIQYTRTALNKRINTQITYETTIIDLEEVPGMENKKIRFGDTFKIKDTKFNPPLYLEARVFEQNRSIKSKAKKDIKLGDFIEHSVEEVNAIWKQLQKEIRNRVSHYEMVEHTYDRLTIDAKDETVFTEGKTFAEATGVTAEENAKAFAVEEDKKIKVDVEQYADNVAEQKANSALDSAKQYAVAKEVYDIQMQNIADDIEDRAPLEYVDGKLVVIDDRLDGFDVELDSKADGSKVYTIEDVDNMINNTVSKTQYTTDMNGIVTDLNDQGTRLGQNETAIGLKADQSSLNAVENSLTTQIGNVEVKADKVEISVVEVRADLDALEIGGRNFIVLERLSSHTSYNSTPVSIGNEIRTIQNTDRTGQVNFTIAIDSFIPENRVYTVSGYLHINGEPLTKDIFRRERVSTYNSSNENIKFYVNESTGYFEFVEEYSGSHRWIFHSDTFLEQGDELIFRDLKFEKGNKATDWTPAPEDTDEAINQVSGRVETLDGEIKAVAGEVALKASQSIVDSLENRVSTAEGELSVLPGQINAKVSKDGAFGELNLSPDKALLDFDRVNVTGKLEAKHIKSLAGLNVNDQFVVDSSGKVTIGNDRVMIDDKSISITRPDGAVWMQDGLVQQDYAIIGYDPYFMDAAMSPSGEIDAFWSDGGYYRSYTGILNGSDQYAVDIRDADKGFTVSFQRYQFIHSARYLVLRLQISTRTNGLEQVRARLYEGDTQRYGINIGSFGSWDALIVDLGTPTYEQRNIDLRIGFLNQWRISGYDGIAFRISRVFLTDFV